ncbi:tetratricopeptide repeat protein [Methanosarcina mazei]|uniref:Tetratricopeptide repeat protein n=1 Tax=Methanosarcina mazei TaxID=2209 RepID=A0A6C0VKP0_METMZ|nr:tetratricopeptide repeat protein [Methanosarcina mazei]QIB91871.1 tetratricopeptide repeat protein [Methanosarcina mazei]
MSRKLQDSAFRLLKKAADDIDHDRYKMAFENLDKVEKIEKEVNNPEISYHLLFFKGFAKYRIDELEESLSLFGKALEISWDLFSKEPEKEDYRSFMRDTIGSIGDILLKLEDPVKAREYISPMKGIFEKAVLGFEKLLESDPENPEYLEDFLETIEHIGLCFEAGELTGDAVPLFDKKFDLIEKLLESETEISEHLSSLDDSLMNFGRMCEGEEYLEEEYIEEAKRVYDRAIEIYGKVLDKDPENSETKVYLSYIYRYLAGIYSDQENLVKAEEYYKEALNLLESEIKEEPENIPVSENIEVSENISVPRNILFSMAIADMYKDSGLIFSDTEDTTKARDYYTKARETFRGLIDKYPDLLEADKNLAISLDELAELFSEIGDFESAEMCYKDELHIYENLLQKEPENPENPEYSLKLSDIYRELGDLFAEEEEIEKARAYYDKEIEIYENLHPAEADKLMLEANKADTWNQIGRLYAEDEPETAVQYHERALPILQEAFESDPTSEFFHEELLETLTVLGTLFKENREFEKAIRMYERVLEVQKQLLELMPPESCHDTNHDHDLDHDHEIDHDHEMDHDHALEHCHDLDIETTYFELGVLHSEIGDEKKASAYHRQALERFEQIIAEQSENPELLILTSGSAFFLGVVLLEKLESENKDSSIAKKYYELALRTIEKLYEAYPMNLKLQEMLASFAEQIGDIYRDADKLEETIQEYEYAYRSLKILYENDPENPKHLHHMLGALNNIGIGYSVTDQQEKGKECFEKALALNENLAKSNPEDLNPLRRNFLLFSNYANLLEEMGDSEMAKEYRKKAEELDAKLTEEDPEWTSLVEEL